MKTWNQCNRGLIILGSIKPPILGPGAPFDLGCLNIYLQWRGKIFWAARLFWQQCTEKFIKPQLIRG